MTPVQIIGAYCFCPVCLFVCLSVCLLIVKFNIRYNFNQRRYSLHIWHVYSTNDAISNGTKVYDFDLCAKNNFYVFVANRGIVFHRHMYFFVYWCNHSWYFIFLSLTESDRLLFIFS